MPTGSLNIAATPLSPEIRFSPDDNIFIIRGTSAPEDVRAMYYPVIEWIKRFVDDVVDGRYRQINNEHPFKLHADLHYFNSSSAKFIYDIFMEIKRLSVSGVPVQVDWIYDSEDLDQKEAGEDIALLAEMEFNYVAKESEA